jgi:methyl-accepting chemotaxis protein
VRNFLEELDAAEMNTRHAVSSLRQGATHVDDAMQMSPEYSDKLSGLSSQLWAMEELVRDINMSIAKLHSSARVAS